MIAEHVTQTIKRRQCRVTRVCGLQVDAVVNRGQQGMQMSFGRRTCEGYCCDQ